MWLDRGCFALTLRGFARIRPLEIRVPVNGARFCFEEPLSEAAGCTSSHLIRSPQSYGTFCGATGRDNKGSGVYPGRDMFAVIKTGGKQYRVEEGQVLLVERLPDEPGATVDLVTLLLAGDGDPVLDVAKLAKSPVKAEIVGHERGKKLRIFKFKPKRGYKRRTGHRQELTRLRITKIGS
jgi:large subunit ribosomal protein L21